MTNHDLARAAVRTINMVPVGMLTDDDVADFIADTYAEPMAELERLRRQVAYVKRGHHSNDGEGWCGVCGNRGKDQEYGHEPDCPHNEVAT